MATYKGINGFAVQSVASDPSPLDEGQVWYNNATYAFKLASVTTVGTFAAGGNMNTGRSFLSSAGTQTATLGFGGTTSGDGQMNNTESYNGSSWTAVSTLNTGRRMLGGAGTQTAALAFGGFIDAPAPVPGAQNITESWNGSSWTNLPGTMPEPANLFASFGTQTSALAAADAAPPGVTTQLWNGSSWTTSPGNVNTGRFDLAGCGSQTAGLIFGGFTPPAGPPFTASASSESWNGSTWTATPSLNTARRSIAGAGTQTLAVAFGGDTPPTFTGATELWNGSSWTTNPNSLSTSRGGLSGAGNQTSAIAFGGYNSPPFASAATEEWTGPGAPVTQTITTS